MGDLKLVPNTPLTAIHKPKMKAIKHKPTGLLVIYNPFSGGWELTSKAIMTIPATGPQTVEEFCKLTEEHSPEELELVEIVPVEADKIEEAKKINCPYPYESFIGRVYRDGQDDVIAFMVNEMEGKR